MSYPSLMTSSRAKLLIASVWVTSFVICFPPLVGWNDRHKNLVSSSVAGSSSSDTSSGDGSLLDDEDGDLAGGPGSCHLSCELTNDVGYVVYSALGSFFIPMLVMLFFYWKIYCAAAATTRAINQGFRTTGGKKILGSRFKEERLTLRIHRGRNSVQEHHRSGNSAASTDRDRRYNNGHSNNINSRSRGGSQKGKSSIKMKNLRPQLIMKSSISLPPDMRYDGNNFAMTERCDLCNAQCTHGDHHGTSVELLTVARGDGGSKTSPADSCYTVDTNFSEIDDSSSTQQRSHHHHHQEGDTLSPTSNCEVPSTPSNLQTRRYHHHHHHQDGKTGTGGGHHVRTRGGGAAATSRMGRRNIRVQVKRFRMETKAAKTLGIIVGVFILCWFPFFTMYLVRGFCPDCIHPLLFSVLFWLGYCNSAVNPCIYALFSKDFRFAFKNILCKCICTREARRAIPSHQQSIYIPSYDRDNDSDDEDGKR